MATIPSCTILPLSRLAPPRLVTLALIQVVNIVIVNVGEPRTSCHHLKCHSSSVLRLSPRRKNHANLHPQEAVSFNIYSLSTSSIHHQCLHTHLQYARNFNLLDVSVQGLCSRCLRLMKISDYGMHSNQHCRCHDPNACSHACLACTLPVLFFFSPHYHPILAR